MCELWLGGGGVVWPRPLGSFDRQVGWVEGGGQVTSPNLSIIRLKRGGGGGVEIGIILVIE